MISGILSRSLYVSHVKVKRLTRIMAQLGDEQKVKADDDIKAADAYDPKDTDGMFEKYTARYVKVENTIGFPLETNSIFSEDFENEVVYKHMTQTYPLCHGSALLLAHRFLKLKREYGSALEKKFYAKLSITDIFDRITTKRAVVFYNASDSFMLRNGKRSGRNWERVGQDTEMFDEHQMGDDYIPKLKDYLSYDELMLSALCGVSSPTHFINTGDRNNRGRVNHAVEHEPQGIYMGLIGARFEKKHVMEHALMVISKEQNTEADGYGKFYNDKHRESLLDRLDKAISDDYFLENVKKSQTASKRRKKAIFSLFESFYSRPYFPTFDEVQSNLKNEEQKQDADQSAQFKERYSLYRGKYLDKEMWIRRIRISLELFLFDSDHRAKAEGKKAFCHLVGLGAGYWSFNRNLQDREMVKVVKQLVNDAVLNHIEVIYFSWFGDDSMRDDDGELILYEGEEDNIFTVYDKKENEIKCEFGRRNPAGKLPEEHEDCLLTACFAWDSNSWPGNEYWLGQLSASGDPAAAACSTVPFIQNCEINKEYLNGGNAHFYFVDPETGNYEIHKMSDIQKDFEANQGEKWLIKSAKSIPYKRDKFVGDKKDQKKKGGKGKAEEKSNNDNQ